MLARAELLNGVLLTSQHLSYLALELLGSPKNLLQSVLALDLEKMGLYLYILESRPHHWLELNNGFLLGHYAAGAELAALHGWRGMYNLLANPGSDTV